MKNQDKSFDGKLSRFVVTFLLLLAVCVAAEASVSDFWYVENECLVYRGSGEIISGTHQHEARKIVIEEGITGIFDFAFREYTKLETVSIEGSTLTSIGYEAFSECPNLKSINIPGSVKTINMNIFDKSRNLENVILGEGMETISAFAFRHAALKEITIPASVSYIGECAFSTDGNLTAIHVAEGSNQYISINGILFTKDKTKLVQYPSGKKDSSYAVPAGVTVIYGHALSECRNLLKIECPSGLTDINEYAFCNCENLLEIELPNSLKVMDQFAFQSCVNLKNIYFRGTEAEWETLTENFPKWDDNMQASPAFHFLCTVSFHVNGHGKAPEAVETMEGKVMTPPADPSADGWTFTGWYREAACENKWNFDKDPVPGDMTLYAGWEEIPAPPADPDTPPAPGTPSGSYTAPDGSRYNISGGNATFVKPNSGTTNITVPDTITVDGNVIPVTSIADGVCSGNNKITTVTIGKNVKTVGKKAFSKCKNLKTVKGGKGVVTIKDSAFASDAKLKTVPGFAKLQALGASSFKGCKVLEKVTLGKSVKKIGKSAFEGCRKLKTITIQTTKLKKSGIGKNCFKGIDAKPTVKCPKKQLKNYKTWLTKVGKMPGKAKFK